MLFKRLHFQLTGLCALITIAILSIFTVLYLSVAEHTMKENVILSCHNRFDTLSGSIEQQSVLTYQYLLRMEQNNDCMIFLWDNGIPLSFNALENHDDYRVLADNLYETYVSRAAAGLLSEPVFFSDCPPPEMSSSQMTASEMTASKTPISNTEARLPSLRHASDLYMGIGNISVGGINGSQKAKALKNNQGFVLLALFPSSDLRDKLLRQRWIFALLSLAGCLLLTLFSYLFTGRILKPLRENQEKQLAFIAGASHELRTPLAVILSAASARPPHFEETIKSEAARCGRLVDELLLLTRLDGDTKSSNQTSVYHFALLEPDTLLLDFYEQMENYVLSKKRHLSLRLSTEPLPRLYADSQKLHQLLEILLQNAVSYTEEDGHILLGLSYDSGKKQLCFEVSDDGIGIPDSEKEKIFERFYRVENSRSSKEHFGLGLCIAKEIVKAHRGRITVSDAPGGGSAFLCYFPVKK